MPPLNSVVTRRITRGLARRVSNKNKPRTKSGGSRHELTTKDRNVNKLLAQNGVATKSIDYEHLEPV